GSRELERDSVGDRKTPQGNGRHGPQCVGGRSPHQSPFLRGAEDDGRADAHRHALVPAPRPDPSSRTVLDLSAYGRRENAVDLRTDGGRALDLTMQKSAIAFAGLMLAACNQPAAQQPPQPAAHAAAAKPKAASLSVG